MKYGQTLRGKFVKRINRFVAIVSIDGQEENVHVKNTGRLKELLIPGAEVILEVSDNPNRKTKYSLIAARKQDRWVNIDSQVPNAVVYDALLHGKIKEFPKLDVVQREVTYGGSRFDLFVEEKAQKGFIEVKGVTLEKDGVALFPDAPTARGMKHIYELISAVEAGYTGTIFFLIQMEGCRKFLPNDEMDKAFAQAVRKADAAGVKILCYDSVVSEDEIIIGGPVKVEL